MKRNSRYRGGPEPAPVERIEVSGKHFGLRAVLAIVCFLIAVVAIGYGIRQSLTVETGWQTLGVNADTAESCAGEIQLTYCIAEERPKAELEAVTAVYTDASVRAFRVFHSTRRFDGVGNLCTLNDAPNETVTVEPELYAALEALERAGRREHYLAPVYSIYEGMYRSVEDSEALEHDPFRNADIARLVSAAAAFAADPDAVRLELLGDCRVCLHVSEKYLAFAREQVFDRFVDLYWMKNAFAVDLIADALQSAGHTRGYLSSNDGFTRNLDGSGESYGVRVLLRAGKSYRSGGVASYDHPMAIVSLHDTPGRTGIDDYYYVLENGEVRTAFIDVRDGLCRCAVPDVYAFSDRLGCAELLLRVIPLFIAEEADPAGFEALASDGACAVLADGSYGWKTADNLQLTIYN